MDKEIKNPGISVIITVYDGDNPEYIDKSIKSIILQNYKNKEIIVSIDGPINEKIEKIIDLYENKVRVVRSIENKGPSSARNLGVKSAKYDFIAIMDADDIADENRLSNEINEMLENKLDVVGSDYIEFDSGKKHKIIVLPKEHKDIVAQLPYKCPIANPTVLIRKEIFNKCGGYNEKMRKAEDYDLWVRIAKSNGRFGNIKTPSIYYRCGKNFNLRRRGFEYAKSDFKVKLSAKELVNKNQYYKVYAVACITFVVRMLPGSLIKIARDIVHK